MRDKPLSAPAAAARPPAARLGLADYYGIEALNAVAATLIGSAIYFWTRHRFHFSDAENLLAAALYGFMYTIGARYGGRWSDRLGLDRALRLSLVALALALGTGWALRPRWLPFVLLAFHGLVVAPAWTSLEGAVVHAAGRWNAARRIGVYNVVWSGGNVVAMALAGALMRWRPDALIWGAGLLHGLGFLWTLRPAARSVSIPPAAPAAEPAPPKASGQRRRLTALSLLGNGLAFLLQYIFFALLPYLAQRTNWSSSYVLWITIAFFLSRCLAFAALSHWTGWHDHPGWSLAALWIAPFCVALIYAAPLTAIVVPALAVLGAAFGLTYYASIFYTLEAGDDKGTQGGIHEAALGVGSCLGPLVCAGAERLLGGARPAIFLVAAAVVVVNGLGGWLIGRRVHAPVSPRNAD